MSSGRSVASLHGWRSRPGHPAPPVHAGAKPGPLPLGILAAWRSWRPSAASASVISPRRWATSSGAPIARRRGQRRIPAGQRGAAPRPARPPPASRRIAASIRAASQSRSGVAAPWPGPRQGQRAGRGGLVLPGGQPAPGGLQHLPGALHARGVPPVDAAAVGASRLGHHRRQPLGPRQPRRRPRRGRRAGSRASRPDLRVSAWKVEPGAAHDHRAQALVQNRRHLAQPMARPNRADGRADMTVKPVRQRFVLDRRSGRARQHPPAADRPARRRH